MAILFDYDATMRQAQTLEELAGKIKNIADNDLEEILSGINQGWQFENATKFLQKGDAMKGKVRISGEDLQNIANTMRKMAENIKTAEEQAAAVASRLTGGGAQNPSSGS